MLFRSASPQGGYQGMIEYIPGEFAHRPVIARGFMFIHCIFVGFRKECKGRGLASSLIEACINDAKSQEMNGVAVVTRKGSFMAGTPQCPYTEKNVVAILETAQNTYKIKTQLIDLKDHLAAQSTPNPFGSFAMLYNGKILSHHPISNTRFENIMNSIIDQ